MKGKYLLLGLLLSFTSFGIPNENRTIRLLKYRIKEPIKCDIVICYINQTENVIFDKWEFRMQKNCDTINRIKLYPIKNTFYDGPKPYCSDIPNNDTIYLYGKTDLPPRLYQFVKYANKKQ